ncbi:MAG TPA: SseB family protein [Micromonosporaceae bacterium]|nr:SseB family protein [Micromonosporaceae bacterium]
MTEWEPATEAETAMRDALRSGDQERYFRILARTELLLPVSADALAGRAPIGWGTWTSGSRTHVLAFTSSEAMRFCLADHAGSARRIAYHELAAHWPNPDWWLAVNPGLPIEGYLPAWFVSQLTRGEVRLPGRDAGTGPRDRLERVESFQRARAVAAVPGRVRPASSDWAALSASAAADGDGPTSVEGAAAARSQPAPRAAGVAPVSPAPDPQDRPGELLPPGRPARSAFEAAAPPAVAPSRPAAPPAAPAATPASLLPPVVAPVPAEAARAERTAIGGGPTRRPSRAAASGFGAGAAAARAGGPAPVRAEPTRPDLGRPERVRPDLGRPEPIRAEPGRPGPVRAELGRPEPVRAEAARPEPGEAPVAEARTEPAGPAFVPANAVESALLAAAGEGNTDSFLSTLLLARVLVPVPAGGSTENHPGDPSFVWRTETIEDHLHVVVFTSPERLVEHVGGTRDTIEVKFAQLIQHWPDEQWSFAVNPGTPVGGKLPGTQIVALANWAAEVGLGAEPTGEQVAPEAPELVPQAAAAPVATSAAGPTVMQKTVPPSQVPYYLDRGYDRVSGFVHRANEVAHLRTPADLFTALGLGWAGSPFDAEADEAYVLRWPAHRPSLYRIPYGGQHEAAMRAMKGWVIERAPFRGNGFAPSESGDVIAEFKVDSARLPHGAQLWRLTRDGAETLVAVLDADGPQWRPVAPDGPDA